ncbi:hypothetical protein CspeluHIS016_0204150 [Cutaneotrichosporon spelunceum]|uniref:Uncharacterized protein n=1 Tax=Cutaneotrichosporon spelunceum TaxID=1672016 RepID=A0AAD3YB37_9TREE|nr:hypothetical protein CspeluHIS016_0204150 [Cutaneotrichosporon spelunceum]
MSQSPLCRNTGGAATNGSRVASVGLWARTRPARASRIAAEVATSGRHFALLVAYAELRAKVWGNLNALDTLTAATTPVIGWRTLAA